LFAQDFNSQAEASIKGAWHASRLWSMSEAEKAEEWELEIGW